MRSLSVRAAAALGWTAGQVWTVAIGLTIAVPAAIFGLGPALHDLPDVASASPPPVPAPSVEAPGSAAVPSEGPVTGPASAPSGPITNRAPAVEIAAPPPTIAAPEPVGASDELARITGPGDVRAIGSVADLVAVAVDRGPDLPGRLVVVDQGGAVVVDRELRVGDDAYSEAAGLASVPGGVVVTTGAPAALLRVGLPGGEVTKVADIPDVAPCVPVVAPTNCQATVPDTAPTPRHVAVAENGDVYVADPGQACIHRITAHAEQAATWLCDVFFSGSPASPDSGLTGLATAPGRLVFTLAAGIDGADTVHDVEISDGAPGARRQLAAGPDGGGIRGVVVLPDGRVVAALASADALLVVEQDGSELRVVNLDGLVGPADLEVVFDELLITSEVDGAAGLVSRRPTSTV